MTKTGSSETQPELPPCRDLDPETVRLLVEGAERIRLEPEEIVYRKGDAADAVYFVLSGRLKLVEGEAGPVIREGDLFGVLEVLSGEGRMSTIAASREAELLHVPATTLNRILRETPGATEKFIEVAELQLLRREMVRLLPHVFGSLDADTLVELGRVFRWLRLERGEQLFAQGDPGDALYLLVSGRLQARLDAPGGAFRVVGEIVPGETVGEMALVSDEPRSATVVALRGCVLQVCDRKDFEALVEAHPQLSRHVSGILVQRLKKANQRASVVHQRLSIAVVPLHAGIDANAFSRPFARALERHGSVLSLDRIGVDERVGHLLSNLEPRLQDLRLLPWFEEQESRHDFVVYEAEPEPTPWTLRCVSQADRIVLVADADHAPGVGELETRIEHVLSGARPPLHLVLLHPADRDRPRGTPAWLEPRDVHRHHHVRRERLGDVERVARLLTGRGLGLVLSGGGARGFAHIGVLTVIDELGLAVDAIGGTSAGAGMAAQYAMGLTPAEMRDVNYREFVVRKPFKKYTLPVYSLASRYAFDRTCRVIAGDLDVSDLWIPFFCTSSDLQTGGKVLHVRGPLWIAARATMSLPGIVPPVVDGSRVLVDGGVLDNMPEEEMMEFCGGPVVAVDVGPGAPIPVDFEYDDMPSPWRVLWDRLSRSGTGRMVPTLLEVLMRTATVSNASQHGVVDDTVDLVLRPPVAEFGLLDFGQIDGIIAAAVPYARERLTAWIAEREVKVAERAPDATGGSQSQPL